MKRKGMLLFLSSLFLAVLLNTSISQATSFYVYDYYDTWSSSWSDANKTSTSYDDDLMCWAAAASNILYWSGWANVDGYSFSSSQDIFEYFQEYWLDEGSSVYYAWEWWFEGTSGDDYSDYESQIDVSGGGDFWTAGYIDSSFWWTPDADYDASSFWWTSDDKDAIHALSDLLENGYGVSLSLTGSTNHAITCWGYETDDDSGRIIGIYVTDSDDDESNGMQYYELTSSSLPGAWYLSEYSDESYYISEVFGLQMSTLSAVPEPATALLFGLGIMGLAVVFRKGQNVAAFPNG